jgi:hypothetical protein
MRVAFGTKAHSGWAVLVVAGMREGAPVVVDRRRIELAKEGWQKAPYHAAEPMKPEAAAKLVARATASAGQSAIRELQAAIHHEKERHHDVAGCGVLVLDPMPVWSVEEVLAVHFRMHKAEGALFRDALVQASQKCGLATVAIHEKHLIGEAAIVLRTSSDGVEKTLAMLGKALGAPWGKDQKEATLAACVALQRCAS